MLPLVSLDRETDWRTHQDMAIMVARRAAG
jgi:hypothetical protein